MEIFEIDAVLIILHNQDSLMQYCMEHVEI